MQLTPLGDELVKEMCCPVHLLMRDCRVLYPPNRLIDWGVYRLMWECQHIKLKD